MKSQARVVVIGGGVVGVSTLYHLVKKGWSDVVLCERKELTSGSTWHAAGLLPLYNLSYSAGQIHKYSMELYKSLADETGLETGFRQVGNIRLATTEDRMDEFRRYAGIAATIGVEAEFLSADEYIDLWPIARKDGIRGAIRHTADGYIQPADLTQSLARGARDGGAEIYRSTKVLGIDATPSGEWRVRTDQGDITCEHVVSATGSHARQTGAMVGLDVPVIPAEHQYLVTEPHPAIVERRAQGAPEMPVFRDPDASFYMREEGGGLVLGVYENTAPLCFENGPPETWENDLFQPDLDRLEPHIEAAIARVPAFSEVGIKQVINGPIAYTPDANPIIGPAWGVRNFWLNEGHSFGITAAGGAGWQMAEWITEGEPSIDMLGVDPRRFGAYASSGYLKMKNHEAHADLYAVPYPNEEKPAARPLKTAPCYDRMKALGAVFGQKNGWERPNWFAPEGEDATDVLSFRRSNDFEAIGAECRTVHEGVGLLDLTAFAKTRVSGPGAEAWLDGLVANRLPAPGRVRLAHVLSANGGVRSEFTIMRDGPDAFYLVSAAAGERHDFDTLEKALPGDGGVRLESLTEAIGVLVLAGPRSRDVLAKLTDADLSTEAFPWMSERMIEIGAAQARAARVSYVGELGWELHHPMPMQNVIFDLLMEAGAEFAIKPFGMRAMDSLRLEKSYFAWGTELSIEYAALESGLDRFVDLDKCDFTGRDALVAWNLRGLDNRFVTLAVDGPSDADARGSEPLYAGGAMVGRVTSGGFGWRVGRSLALAMVRPEHATIGSELEVEILGNRHPATVIEQSPFDPRNERLRS
jgi:dimethylglycine dehydrogenase